MNTTFWEALGQYHPSPFLGDRRHHVGQQVRGAARYDSQDPHRLGSDSPDGDLARRDPLFPRSLDLGRVSARSGAISNRKIELDL